MQSVSSDFAIGLDLLADVLFESDFPKEAFEREREVQLANIQARKDDLLKSASVAMRRMLFGERATGWMRAASRIRRRPSIAD